MMMLAITIIYPLLFDAPPKVVLSITAIYLSFLPASILARQSKFKADSTMCILPVTRNTLILGKYIFTAMLFAVGIILFVLIFLALPGQQYSFNDIINADRFVNVVLAVCSVSAVLIPLILRFGYTGILVFVLGLNILTVIMFVLTYLKLIRDMLNFIFEDFPSAIVAFRNIVGAPGYHLLVLCAAGLLWAASLKISQKIYAGKEL